MIICLIGAPATGKTTLFREMIKRTGGELSWWRCNVGTVVYHQHNKTKVIILGDYSKPGPFAGTDRLSMSVQPQAELFVEKRLKSEEPCAIMFEGDRLGNNSFLDKLDKLAGESLKVIELFASDEVLAARHTERKDTQTEKWLAGRTTKLANIRRARHVERRSNATKEHLAANADYLIKLAGLLPPVAGV